MHEAVSTIVPRVRRNGDVDWQSWPVDDYVAENYRRLHPADAAVIDHHAACYRALGPDSVARSLEVGAGPNLYPLMLAAAVSRQVDVVDPGAPNVAYLQRQLASGADAHWEPFYMRCRARLPALPARSSAALARVRVIQASLQDAPPGSYGLASMNFVAESVTEDAAEFAELCRVFVSSVCPGGLLVAAFMERMGRYRIGNGSEWPGVPVDAELLREVFAPHTSSLAVTRIDVDPSLPAYGHSGMLLLTARRRVAGAAVRSKGGTQAR